MYFEQTRDRRRVVNIENLFLASCYILSFLSDLVAQDKVFSRIVFQQPLDKIRFLSREVGIRDLEPVQHLAKNSLYLESSGILSLDRCLQIDFKKVIVQSRLKNERIIPLQIRVLKHMT